MFVYNLQHGIKRKNKTEWFYLKNLTLRLSEIPKGINGNRHFIFHKLNKGKSCKPQTKGKYISKTHLKNKGHYKICKVEKSKCFGGAIMMSEGGSEGCREG